MKKITEYLQRQKVILNHSVAEKSLKEELSNENLRSKNLTKTQITKTITESQYLPSISTLRSL